MKLLVALLVGLSSLCVVFGGGVCSGTSLNESLPSALSIALNSLPALEDLANASAACTGTNYSVFAPTDSALVTAGLDTLDGADQRLVVGYHIYASTSAVNNGDLTASVLTANPSRSIESLSGGISTLAGVTDQRARVEWDNATSTLTVQGLQVNISNADNFAENGVWHSLLGVLSLPGSTSVTINGDSNGTYASYFSTAYTLIDAASNLIATAADEAYTEVTFLPTNDAVTSRSVPRAYVGALTDSSNIEDLNNVLAYHLSLATNENGTTFYSDVVLAQSSPITVTSKNNGTTFTVSFTGSTPPVSIQSDTTNYPAVTVSDFDFPTANSVIHGLDGILIPSNVDLTYAKLLGGLSTSTLISLLTSENLLSTFTDTPLGSFTVFAPSDAALSAVNDQLENANATEVLLNHVVSGLQILDSAQTLTALSGNTLDVTVSSGVVSVQLRNVEPLVELYEAARVTYNGTVVGVIYGCDEVIGVEQDTTDDDGSAASTLSQLFF